MLISDILPSPDNERDHTRGIEELMASIEAYGFVGTIALRGRDDPTVVAGHGRLEALRRLGWTEVPDERIEFLDRLTDDEVAAFRIADNKTGDLSRWNKARLKNSVRRLEAKGFDLKPVGFDFKAKALPYGAERGRTGTAYNLDKVSRTDCGPSGFPELPTVDVRPDRLVGFNYAKSMVDADKAGACCHFFLDDYQFERVWSRPERYLDVLRGFDCVVAPDFSLYLDMPAPMQAWNLYRSLALARWWSDGGVTVVPNLTWAQPETYGWCFSGVPEGSTVAVSSVGCSSRGARAAFNDGLAEALRRCRPSRLLWYGPDTGADVPCEVVRFENERFGGA